MSHHHSHDHSSHHHNHHHDQSYGNTFFVAVALNTVFLTIEAFYGFVANSTALIADAGHNLSDVLGLLLAWGAIYFAKKQPEGRYTFGLRGSTIIAALGNAAFLLVACGAIAVEAVHRFSETTPVAGATVSIVAGIGILVNGISALMLSKGSKDDINIRGAYLHMLADAAISFGVVLSGITIIYTGWGWLDPLVSILISVAIVHSTWGLLKESLKLAINAAPESVRLDHIEQYLRSLKGVTDVHDLHVWAISTTENALTVHLVMPDGYPSDLFVDSIAKELLVSHNIHHSTIQVEQGTTNHTCHLLAY
jgi:cobalt-zinc-cadmium efflux system protein